MADSSRVRVSVVVESSFGTTPASPAMQCLPVTGVSLKPLVQYVESAVINPTRNVQDLVRLSKSTAGGIPCELRYSPSGGGLDLAIRSLLCSTFTAAVTTGSCAITSGNNEITRAAGSFVSDGYEVGDIIKVTNYSSGDEWRRILSVAALTLGVEGEDFNATDAAVTVTRGARIKNGTTTPSLSVEVAHLDLQKALLFKGSGFNTADIAVAVGALTTINFGLLGQTVEVITSNTGTTDQFIAGATYTAPAAHPTLSPVDVQEISVGGTIAAAASIGVSWSNNIRARERLGAEGPQSLAFPKFGVNGTVRRYFENFDSLSDYIAGTESDLWYSQTDANGRGYAISYPRTKYSNVEMPVQSNDSDVYETVAMTALEDQTEGCSVRLHRLGD